MTALFIYEIVLLLIYWWHSLSAISEEPSLEFGRQLSRGALWQRVLSLGPTSRSYGSLLRLRRIRGKLRTSNRRIETDQRQRRDQRHLVGRVWNCTLEMQHTPNLLKRWILVSFNINWNICHFQFIQILSLSLSLSLVPHFVLRGGGGGWGYGWLTEAQLFQTLQTLSWQRLAVWRHKKTRRSPSETKQWNVSVFLATAWKKLQKMNPVCIELRNTISTSVLTH